MRVIKAWINQFLFGGRRTAFDWGNHPIAGSRWACPPTTAEIETAKHTHSWQ